MTKLLIVGTGNTAQEVKDFVRKYNLFEIVGYAVNERYIKDKYCENLPVYPLEKIESYINKDVKLFIGIGWGQRLNQVRKDIFISLKEKGFSFANLIAPQSVIMTDKIGEGNFFYEFSYIGHDAEIGNNNEFRAFSTIGHFTKIGSHNHISKCTIGGATVLGDCNYVGMQAIIYNRIKIGDKNFIGAGTIIKKDMDNYNVVSATESPKVQLTEKQIEYVVSPNGKNFLK